MPGPVLGQLLSRARRPAAIAAGAILAAAFAVHAGDFGHAFLLNWDDLEYLVANDAAHGLGWRRIAEAFGHSYVGNYAPLHIVSYAVDATLFGLRPWGFLLTNVLLHAANGLLLCAFLRRTGVGWAASTAGALLFVVHPVQVESVAWISQRKNVLSLFFFLAALHAWWSYRERQGWRSGRAYLGALAAGLAALLTKAAAVGLVPVLLVLDLTLVPAERRRRLILDKLPLLVATAVLAAATLASQATSIAEGRAVFAMDRLTTVYTMLPVAVRYLGLLAAPVRLSALYAPPVRSGPDGAVVASALLVLALVALGIVLYRRARPSFFWTSTYFVSLAPVMQVVPLPTLMNDRYLYFPMVGAAGLAALLLDRASRARSAALRRAIAVMSVAALALLATASRARTEAWRDDLTLWTDTARNSPGVPLAWAGLGMSLLDAGRREEALAAFLQALALDRDHPLALNDVGALYTEAGRPDLARPYLLRAVRVAADPFSAWMNLGAGYRQAGDLALAEAAFRSALAARPGAPVALRALAEVAAEKPGRPHPP